MVEAALNVAAELLLEHDAYGVDICRDGNRGPFAAPQGCYRCRPLEADDDRWLCLSIEDDAQWAALTEHVHDPRLAKSDWSTVAARRVDHDAIDAEIVEE